MLWVFKPTTDINKSQQTSLYSTIRHPLILNLLGSSDSFLKSLQWELPHILKSQNHTHNTHWEKCLRITGQAKGEELDSQGKGSYSKAYIILCLRYMGIWCAIDYPYSILIRPYLAPKSPDLVNNNLTTWSSS
jgi:hypothetical protein